MSDIEQGTSNNTTSSASKCWNCLTKSDSQSSLRYVRMSNLCNAILVIIAGVLSFMSLSHVIHPSAYAISFYVICFGALLCCFELRIKYFDQRVRKNFGFMYTFTGRTIFLLFLASFCVGLYADDNILSIVTGVFTSFNALFNCFVIWKHGKLYEDPTETYTDAGAAAGQYIASHPELAKKAVSGGMAFAQNNPQAFKAGVDATMEYAKENPDVATQVARDSMKSGENPFQVNVS